MTLNYLLEHWRGVLSLSWDHLLLSGTALAVALAIAIPLGVIVARVSRVSLPVLGALGIVYTIPSLALLAFLIPWLGLGRTPAIVVLAAFAQLALVRNIAAGLQSVDPATLEAAHGAGMTSSQVFWTVHVPLAIPVLIAGLRVATVSTISLASVTAWINAGGLGSLMFDGISRDNSSMILAGAISIAALAIGADLFFRALEQALTRHRHMNSR